MRLKAVETFIVFLMTFFVVFIIYSFIFIRDYRQAKKIKKNKNVDLKKEPVEIRLLKYYYKVDISKLDYSSVLRRVAFVSSFDISLIVTTACITNLGLLQIAIACAIIFPVVYLSYLLLAKMLKRKIKKQEMKGKMKNE